MFLTDGGDERYNKRSRVNGSVGGIRMLLLFRLCIRLYRFLSAIYNSLSKDVPPIFSSEYAKRANNLDAVQSRKASHFRLYDYFTRYKALHRN